MIETPFVRIKSRVVLPRPPSTVTCRPENLSNQCGFSKVPVAAMMIQPSKEADSSSPALRSVVGLGVPNPIFGQSIQTGCLDLPTITSKVGIPHVVRQYEYKIWTPPCEHVSEYAIPENKTENRPFFNTTLHIQFHF